MPPAAQTAAASMVRRERCMSVLASRRGARTALRGSPGERECRASVTGSIPREEPRVTGDGVTLEADRDDARAEVHRIAVEDDQVGVLALVQRAAAVVDAEHRRR